MISSEAIFYILATAVIYVGMLGIVGGFSNL